MKAMQRVWMIAATIGMVGCAAEVQEPQVSQSVHEITVVDCQVQLADCTRSARTILGRVRCSTEFTACNAQAAVDLLTSQDLLAQCRSDANQCLEGALSIADISACRDLYGSCASDLIDAADDALRSATDAARGAVEEAVNAAEELIETAGGVVDGALGAVDACRSEAFTCLESVASLSDVSSCRSIFAACTEDAVSLVDSVAELLPVPAPGEVIESLGECRAQSESCLEGALTVSDISACRAVLETCVDNVTDLAIDVASELDDLVGVLPLPVPEPSTVVDCSAQLSACLLSLTSPFVCANQARECANL